MAGTDTELAERFGCCDCYKFVEFGREFVDLVREGSDPAGRYYATRSWLLVPDRSGWCDLGVDVHRPMFSGSSEMSGVW